MGTCSVEHVGASTVVRFSAVTPDGTAVWPAAVVVWRGDAPSLERGLRAQWRAFRYRRGIDPLHATFTIGRHAGLWMGFAGPEGEGETLFHPERHVVRVLDRSFSVPAPGQTLVLLIGADEARARRPIARTMPSELQRLEHGVAVSHAIRVGPHSDPADPLVALSRSDSQVRTFLA